MLQSSLNGPDTPWSRSFEQVLREELRRISDEPDSSNFDPIARAHKEQLLGLAFSGGGIRSATFNLGVLQSLARLNLLPKVDYLSTVSGGGYIGSWLMAWMKRAGVRDATAGLTPERRSQPAQSEREQIYFLRRFSNYLTPKLGWLGADMWTVISVYLRNLILNLLVLSSAFACALLAPRWIALIAKLLWKDWLYWFWALIALAALIAAAVAIIRSMRYFGPIDPKQRRPPELVKKLDEQNEWKAANGEAIGLPSPDAPSWYGKELFGDFVLSLDFEMNGPAHGRVYVWTPWISNNGSRKPLVNGAVEVLIEGDENGSRLTGAINQQRASRVAAIMPGKNLLQISCVDERCTVRVNEETVNTLRVQREKQKRTGLFAAGGSVPGAIGLDPGGGIFSNLNVEKIESASSTGATQGQVQRRVIAPLFLAAFLATFIFAFGDGDYTFPAVPPKARPLSAATCMREWLNLRPLAPHAWSALHAAIVTGLVSGGLVFFGYLYVARRSTKTSDEKRRAILPSAVSMAIAAGVGGSLLVGLYWLFQGCTVWGVMTWGTPAVIGAFLLTTVLFIGIMGRALPDERREWWSRLGAWLLIYALAWSSIFALAFYAPPLVRAVAAAAPGWLRLISLSWILSTIAGLIAARSGSTGREESSRTVELLAKITPYIFIAGFLILLSLGVDTLLLHPEIALPSSGFHFHDARDQQWEAMYNAPPLPLLWLTLAVVVVALIFSRRLDINQFSMHLLYRNRLGRCYLGASNPNRRAQQFTGFSAQDDLDLTALQTLAFTGPDSAPYPIINAALNLVGGKELAWQQRKAASFVFTPFHCGYDFPELPPGYCETAKFAATPSPITLGTAMAISGAAASPSMGYHTAPAPAFLMTVFNVRLGWWLGNPRNQSSFAQSSPVGVLKSLFYELFGLTNEGGEYIYLSDGGHFENLGVYELIRRRCRFIISCDAEEDQTFGFGGLGNAIEKCRSDFGIDIDIDVEPIRHRSENGLSEWHCAIGTIYYSRVDRGAPDGILVYLKSSLTGDEPSDVLRYAAAAPSFPHQSTSDQWFDESQFESYRVLGFHIAENFFAGVGDGPTISDRTKEELFVALREAWYPPSAATAESFTKHTRTIVGIYDQLRGNKSLAFLSEYIYPEWRILFEKTDGFPAGGSSFAIDTKRPLQDQLPRKEGELRAGFYLCNSVLQLFEDVYVDLHLEEEYDHPDNRGWMNLFKHWSWAPMLRVTWTICAGNYGARFQTFCERHLGLTLGETEQRAVLLGPTVDWTLPLQFPWAAEDDALARRIASAIWIWLSELPVGSDVTAEAARAASRAMPGYVAPTAQSRKANEEKALTEAKELIDRAFTRRGESPIATSSLNRRDEEWHEAAKLLEFCYCSAAQPLKENAAEKVAEIVLAHAAAITQRLSTAGFINELNSLERELIEALFIFNPSLAASASITRLEISPSPKSGAATPTRRNLHFPFGFAVQAKTAWPPEPNEVPKLVYFRVQDHLRKMGFAREALEKMISDSPNLGIELKKMHPKACEVPTERDRAHFVRLFHSARIALCERRTARPSETW